MLSYEQRMDLREKYTGRTVRVVAPEGSKVYEQIHPETGKLIKFNDEFLIAGMVLDKIAFCHKDAIVKFSPEDVVFVGSHDDQLKYAKTFIGKKVVVIADNTHGCHPTEDRKIKIGDILHVCDAVQWKNGKTSLVYRVSSKFGKKFYWGVPNQQSVGIDKVRLVNDQDIAEKAKYVGKTICVVEQDEHPEHRGEFTQAHPTEDRKIEAGDLLKIVAVGKTNKYNIPVLGYEVPNKDVYSEVFGWGMQQLYVKCASFKMPAQPKLSGEVTIERLARLYCHQKVIVTNSEATRGMCHPTESRMLKNGDVLEIVAIKPDTSFGSEFVLCYNTDPKFGYQYRGQPNQQAIDWNHADILGMMDDYKDAVVKYMSKDCVFLGSSICHAFHPTEDRYLRIGDVVQISHVGYNPSGYLVLGFPNSKHSGFFGEQICSLNADLFKLYDPVAEGQRKRDKESYYLGQAGSPEEKQEILDRAIKAGIADPPKQEVSTPKTDDGILVTLGKIVYKLLS